MSVTDAKTPMYEARTGICTTDFPKYGAYELFARAAGYGYTVVQFGFQTVDETSFDADGRIEFPDFDSLSPGTISIIERAAMRSGVEVGAVNGTFNAAHPDAEVRAEGVRRFSGLASASRALGCKIITLCSGTRNEGNLWAPHPENGSADAWRDMKDTILRLCEIAEREDITLAVETEVSNVISSPDAARRLLDEVGSPRLKMILDPANLFPPGSARPENVRPVLKSAFGQFGRDIVLAHGKDIRSADDIEFCGTGEGIVDFAYLAQLLREYGFAGDMMLHGIYDERKFTDARRFWERMLRL
jgi:sugar phosphate isomerase/epimerase